MLVKDLYDKIENEIEPIVKKYKRISFHNQKKVLNAFIKHKISDFHFAPSTGYGYGDIGRDKLEDLFADIFGGESALVRPHIVSGTHAISLGLLSNLNPGDELLSIGRPYDTLQKVIGISNQVRDSLISQGVIYKETPIEAIEQKKLYKYITAKTKIVFIQRSRGYQERKTFTIEQIKNAVEQIKNINVNIIIMVDNCYGEFVDEVEPCEIGADLVAGSLIKNPGGGLAPTGGYIVGKKNLVERACNRLTAPGLGMDMGSSTADKRLFYQGLFMSPHIVQQALESAIFASRLFELQGFMVSPKYDENRGDIIQTIIFDDKGILLEFCKAVQNNSPIDSKNTPEPALLPGYDVPVIMAAGTFVQGASIELSVDAPVKEPYIAYLQGGLTSESSKQILLRAVKQIKLIS